MAFQSYIVLISQFFSLTFFHPTGSSTTEKKVKVSVKGAAAVDPESGNSKNNAVFKFTSANSSIIYLRNGQWEYSIEVTCMHLDSQWNF